MKYDLRKIAKAMLAFWGDNYRNLHLLNTNDFSVHEFDSANEQGNQEKAQELLREYDCFIFIPQINDRAIAQLFIDNHPVLDKKFLNNAKYFFHDFRNMINMRGLGDKYWDSRWDFAMKIAKNWVDCNFEIEYMDEELKNMLLLKET